MVSRIFVSVIASLALCAPAALAADAPPPPPPPGLSAGPGPDGAGKPAKEDMAKMHAMMRTDGYAREVGKLATLEVRLNLSAKQKPLFEKWKAVKLAAVKARAEKCSENKPSEPFKVGRKAPDLVAGLKTEESRLKDRLGEITAELPTLSALVASLSDGQKAALMPMGLGPHHHMGPPARAPYGGPEAGPGMPPPEEHP